jgi:hypothetical protein
MDRNGWSGTRLAREIGTSQPWVSMVLTGKRDPLRQSIGQLERVGWEVHVVPKGDDDPVRRRDFLAAAACTAFVPPAKASPYTSPDYLEAIAARLARNEAQLGGGPLAREAARHTVRAGIAARDGGTQLQAAASRLLRQCALVMHDVRQLTRAEQTAAAALKLARTAGDRAAQAQALNTLSLITAHQSDGRGVEYARHGFGLAGADDERAILAARVGRALALAPGRKPEARRWLDRALELQADGDAEIAGNCGIGYTDAGIPALGERYLADAAGLTAASPHLHALYAARQAKTAIRAGQPEQAAGKMTELAALAPLVDSPRLSIHLRHIHDGTRRWDAIRDVRDARDALKEAMA